MNPATNLKLIMNTAPEITTIATSAVLIDLTISNWAGRKKDRKSTEEVVKSNYAGSTKAASVTKNLMTDDKDLDAIRAYAQETRLWLQGRTLAWGDRGTRLLPSKNIIDVAGELDARVQQYDTLVAKFIQDYAIKVSAAAFKLGALFKREEFPSADSIARRFAMRYCMTPVPTSGDFRVDVQNDVGAYLQAQFQKAAEARLVDAMREPWQRAFETLQHAKERLEAALAFEPSAEGEVDKRRSPKIYQSMFDNAVELAQMLDTLNLTGDAQLADCAAKMRRLFSNVDVKSLRESVDQQAAVKKQVDDMLGAFDFGSFGEE